MVYSDVTAAQVYFANGDLASARARQDASYTEWRARLSNEPTNAIATATVGQMEAVLGHAEEAVRLGRKAVELVPESRDAVDGPYYLYDLATVYAMNGAKDQAIAELGHVILTPTTNNSVALIRTDPALTKLHGDPRFEALLNDPKNNAPLF